MSLTITKIVHGFLARFNDAGALQGAQVEYREVKSFEGEVLSDKLLDPQPVAPSDAAVLEEISATINASALANITTLEAERDAAIDAKVAAEGECDAAMTQISQLQAQLVTYQTVVDSNGIPVEVTMRQAQLALLGAGLLDAVEAAIAAYPGDAGKAARITWYKSSTVRRSNPLILALMPLLGLTSQQVDALFVVAATL